MVDVTPGTISFQVIGPNASEIFKDEAGGHRWQRVPPNERNGRVHTSTITVSVLSVPEEREFSINVNDITIEAIRGSGDGGQKKNKTSSCIVATHKPSGLRVRIETERSQYQNKVLAIGILEARLKQASALNNVSTINTVRKQHCGSGMRGDKRRTVRVQHGIVDDHVTGQSWRIAEYFDGKI